MKKILPWRRLCEFLVASSNSGSSFSLTVSHSDAVHFLNSVQWIDIFVMILERKQWWELEDLQACCEIVEAEAWVARTLFASTGFPHAYNF